MRRIVLDCPLTLGQEIEFTSSQAHYLFKVLRLQAGTKILGLDSTGRAYIIELASTPGLGMVLAEAEEDQGEPNLAISVYVPLLKGDKLDLVVQKAVELGATAICLVSTQRCIVNWAGKEAKKLARLQKIAQSATEQCRRHKVPLVQGVFSLAEVSANPGIFPWEQEHSTSLQQYLHQYPPQGRLSILTGPEGGLTDQEAKTLTDSGWAPVTLGTRILRAETAAIVSLACTMFACGEMG